MAWQILQDKATALLESLQDESALSISNCFCGHPMFPKTAFIL